MRLLEFAIELTEHNYNIILIDSSDISSITKIDNHTCQLLTKSNQTYKVIGTYRNLTNRFIYALSKKHNFMDDDIMRPSMLIFHRPEHLNVDQAMFDAFQLHAFILALIPPDQLANFYIKLDNHLYDLFKHYKLIP